MAINGKTEIKIENLIVLLLGSWHFVLMRLFVLSGSPTLNIYLKFDQFETSPQWQTVTTSKIEI